MARKSSDDVDSEDLSESVPAVYARGPRDAERYVQLLADHDIDAVVDPDYSPPETDDDRAPVVPSGVPILVAKAVLEDAQAFIADMDDLNGFIPNGEDEDDLDDEDLLPGREGPEDYEDLDPASLLEADDAVVYDQDDEDDEAAEEPEEAH